MRRLVPLMLVLFLTLAGPSGTGAAGTGAAGTGGGAPLVVGSLGPETGDLSPIIDSLRVPVQIAVDEMNAAGGVNGHDVTFVTGDEDSDPLVAAQSLETMVTTGQANVIIGPASGSIASGVLERIEADDVLACSGSTTPAGLTDSAPGQPGGRSFRTAPPDRLQGPALSELVPYESSRARIATLL